MPAVIAPCRRHSAPISPNGKRTLCGKPDCRKPKPTANDRRKAARWTPEGVCFLPGDRWPDDRSRKAAA